jgi:O-antigen/teichoic acid export membrane protein
MHKTLILKLSIMLLLSTTAYAVNYGLNIVLTHLLPPAAYGDFAIIKEIILFTSLLFLQGSNFAVLKYIPEYVHANEYGLLHGYLRYTFKTFIISSCLLAALTLFFSLFLLTKYSINISIYLLLLVAASTLVFSIFSYAVELLRAFKRIFLSTILFDILMPLLFAIAAIYLQLKKYQTSLLLITALYLITLLLTNIITGFFCYQKIKKYLLSNITNSALWRSSSAHLMISKLVLTILFSSEIIILKIFGNIPADTGIFAAILTVGSLYWVLFNAVTYVLSPLISPLVYGSQKQKLRQLFLLSTGFLTLLATILSAILIFWRIPILQYFGNGFVRGSLAYSITIIGFAITVSLGLPWYFIGLSGHQQKLVWPVFWVTICSILITSILVNYFNLLGAAIGLAATDVIMGLLLIRLLYKLEVF